MSRYLDQYIPGGTVQPEVSLAADLITRIGHRPGLSNLNNAAERFSLEQMFKTLLSKTSAEELRYLLWWSLKAMTHSGEIAYRKPPSRIISSRPALAPCSRNFTRIAPLCTMLRNP